MSTYDITEEPIVLSKPLLDQMLKREFKHKGDLIALYSFYYYTAKWQKTNHPKATTDYTSKGLGWSPDRVRRTKAELISMKLIENHQCRSSDNKITGHYIQVNFIWSSHPSPNPECGNGQTLGNQETNALSANSLNALSADKVNASEAPSKPSKPLALEGESGSAPPKLSEPLQAPISPSPSPLPSTPPDPPPKPVKSKDTWLTEYNEIHKRILGGDMNFGQAGPAFKKTEASFGREKSLSGWEAHCKAEGQYASPTYYSSKALVWMPKAQVTHVDISKPIFS